MSFGISIGDVIKLCEMAGRVYKNCRDCTGEYKSLTSEARNLTNLLEDIQDKYDKTPESKRQQLVDAYEPCIDVLQELDKILLHYNSLDTKAARTWDRLTYDPERTKTLRERLVTSIAMLNTFYISLIQDSQVLILEALERLERDYKGGHREESIASIERITSDDAGDDDAAWTQILRDLEDAGVSQQEAISYRELIVDWLVIAVNEGRLQEQEPDQDVYSTMRNSLMDALSPQDAATISSTPSLDDSLTNVPPQKTQSAPSVVHGQMVKSGSPMQPSHLILSEASAPGFPPRSISPSMASQTSDDAASLYAPPSIRITQPSQNEHHAGRVSAPTLGEVYGQGRNHILLGSPTKFSPAASVSLPTLHVPLVPPPSDHQDNDSISANLEWKAQQIVAAWNRHDFLTAEKLLEDQLLAVERGRTVVSGTQPDRRVLRHLIGICASFSGNFVKAKRLFESVFNGIYLHRFSLDEGDIAAARWLGDVCLHLREHQNALLAYSVACEGSLGRFGIAQERTRRAAVEIRVLDHWLFAFGRIEYSFHLNIDPTDIFASTHAIEKSNLIHAMKSLLYDMKDLSGLNFPDAPIHQFMRPTFTVGRRPQIDMMISEGFLLAPLISASTWPLPWDPTFSPQGAVQLDRYMNTIQIAKNITPLVDRPLPINTLGNSKVLHYITKRGSEWLISSVKRGLREMGIEHAEHGYEPSIVCCLNQYQSGFAFSEGVEIIFRRLQFRNVHGIRISDVRWSTRKFGPIRTSSGSPRSALMQGDSTDFRNMVKDILQTAEAEASGGVKDYPGTSTSRDSSSRRKTFTEKRAAYG